MDDRLTRITGIAGLVVALLLVGSGILGSELRNYDATTAAASQYYMRHSAQVLVTLDLQFLNIVPFLVFLVGLRTIVQRAEGNQGMFASFIFAAGLTLVPTLLIWHAMPAALAVSVQNGNTRNVRLFLTLGSVFDGIAGLPMGLMVGATSFAMLRFLDVGRWISWFGFLAATLAVAGALDVIHPNGALSLGGHFGFLLFVVWVVATSVALLRTTDSRGSDMMLPAQQVRAILE